jgi:dolichyl-phosphate beta-glucosyltransferase
MAAPSSTAATTWLVVPAYDEERRLRPDALLEAAEADPEIRFLLVDDGSADGTLALLRSLQAARPDRFDVLALPRNGGKGEAVRRGVLEALDGGAAFLGYWDADLATPLSDATSFRDVLRGNPDVHAVLGSRVRLLGHPVDRGFARHVLGRTFATMASRLLRLPVYDTQCGAKLFRAGPHLRALFGEPFLSRWIFDVEILARWVREHRAGRAPPPLSAIREEPVSRWTDPRGSKVRAMDFVRAARDLRRIRRRVLEAP